MQQVICCCQEPLKSRWLFCHMTAVITGLVYRRQSCSLNITSFRHYAADFLCAAHITIQNLCKRKHEDSKLPKPASVAALCIRPKFFIKQGQLRNDRALCILMPARVLTTCASSSLNLNSPWPRHPWGT